MCANLQLPIFIYEGMGNIWPILTPNLTPGVPQNGSNIEICQKPMLLLNFLCEIMYVCKFAAPDLHLSGNGQYLTTFDPHMTPGVHKNDPRIEICYWHTFSIIVEGDEIKYINVLYQNTLFFTFYHRNTVFRFWGSF